MYPTQSYFQSTILEAFLFQSSLDHFIVIGIDVVWYGGVGTVFNAFTKFFPGNTYHKVEDDKYNY
jgi:hypothetical protein